MREIIFHVAHNARPMTAVFTLSDGTVVHREVKAWVQAAGFDRLEPCVVEGAQIQRAIEIGALVSPVAGARLRVVGFQLVEGYGATPLDRALNVTEADEALADLLPEPRDVTEEFVEELDADQDTHQQLIIARTLNTPEENP